MTEGCFAVKQRVLKSQRHEFVDCIDRKAVNQAPAVTKQLV